jgi:transcription elongation factor GreA
MSLTLLAATEKWPEFDAAWSELMGSEEPVDELVQALRLVLERKRIARCLGMVREHAQSLEQRGRAADAARLYGIAVQGGGPPGEFAGPLYAAAEKAWGREPWWEPYTRLSGLKADLGDPRKSWVHFERLTWFQPGRLVYHGGGWGTGEVEAIDLEALELTIRFANGRKDRFPLNAAMEIFEPLAEIDLRAQHFRDPNALRKKIKDEPLIVLRNVLERHHGRASTISIKNALAQVGVDGTAWNGWWRKARKQAESSEWFKVTGTPLRGEVQLLHTAMDAVADLNRQLENATNLSDVLARVREQLQGNQDERMREMLLTVLEAKATPPNEPLPLRMSAWLLLREERSVAPEPLLATLRAAAAEPPPGDPGKPPALWALFQSLPGLREQERCVSALQEVFGDAWADEAVRNLQHAPSGMARLLVDTLFAAGRAIDLGAAYKDLLARPLRAPEVLLSLARLGESGKLPGEMPTPVQRAQALLALASYLHVNRRGDANNARSNTRVVEFLTKGKDSVLRRLLAGADPDSITSLQRTVQRGVDEAIDNQFTDIYLRAAPAAMRSAQGFFWESDRIYTTRKGLEKRKAELHHLREVKIPANQEAIGRAAAMGDLSENSEWEAAIEEQRTLTTRAAEIEGELRRAEALENEILPEGVVGPGMQVRYRELPGGVEHRIAILGPWDTDTAEHVVSYRAPLAAGLLGKKPGERVRVTLPSGQLDIQVVGVEPVPLGD